jgi:hypothetical protein
MKREPEETGVGRPVIQMLTQAMSNIGVGSSMAADHSRSNTGEGSVEAYRSAGGLLQFTEAGPIASAEAAAVINRLSRKEQRQDFRRLERLGQ